MKNLVICLIAIVIGYLVFSPSKNNINDFDDQGTGIVLYTAAGCRYCKLARNDLIAAKVSFKEYDVNRSDFGAKRFRALNGRGVPLIEANGVVVRGYSKQSMAKLISNYK